MDFGPHLMIALIEGAVLSAVLALMASGLSLTFGVMRVVNVAHGEFYMLGAVAAWFIAGQATSLGLGPSAGFLAALILAPLAVGTLAIAADRLVLSRLNYDPERTIVATIGLLYIFQQTTLMGFGPEARPVSAPFNARLALPWIGATDDGWGLIWPWGLSVTTYKLFVVAAATAILLTLRLALMRSRAGLIMRATEADRDTATAFGIPVRRVYALTFGLGAGLAALAGVLIVPISQAQFLMGGDALLLSFIVVIIGGLGSLSGTVLAAVLIGMSEGIISVFFSPTLAKIVSTLLVALVLVVRPQGLFGGARR
jgi:branched-chain amino acid transport system permease protein